MSSPDYSQLINEWLNQTISPEDFALLEKALREDPAVRHQFRRLTNLDASLRDWAGRDVALAAWLPANKVTGEDNEVVRKVLFQPWMWAVAAALAALLCLASFQLGGHHSLQRELKREAKAQLPVKSEETDQGYAVLTQTVGAEWAGDVAKARLGDTLNEKHLTLKKGLAQIEFFSGATLLLEGPADLEIVSAWEVICHQGKARVRVPPAAHGFKLSTPGMKLVDLGTEFGVEVNPRTQDAQVHVFEGEVEAHPQTGAQMNLKEGQGIEKRGDNITRLATVRPEDFVDIDRLHTLSLEQARARFDDWWKFSLAMRKDPRLILYYPMRHWTNWNRLVSNAAMPGDKSKNGGVVGAVWTQGRWPQKDGLEFKRPGDRVRLQVDGTFNALTFACWAKVDGLDRKYNALILTDGYDPGAPHWQIYEDGRLMFSIAYPDPSNSAKKLNQIYFSPVIFTRSNTGRWHHLAVTYDNQTGEAIQYVDGHEVSREVSPYHAPGRPLAFGPCELGNWGLPTPGHRFPIRNLNGSLDEFAIYRSALSADEIHKIYEAGKPE